MNDNPGSGRRLMREACGSVLPMAAAGIFLTMALIGGGVDMSRAYKAESRLQAACDAAVLAGRRTVTTGGFDDVAQEEADNYFDANFDDTQQDTRDTTFDVTSPDDGQTVEGTASSTIPTVIMQIFGFDELPISVECTASMGVGNSDITFVLDTTGSMGWTADGDTTPDAGETTRLADLQAAMKNFYDTVDDAMSSSNARVRYAMVPYSSSVNVGQLIVDEDPDYLVDTYNIQSRAWLRWGTATTTGSSSSTGSTTYGNSWTRITSPSYTTSAACNAALPADTAWANNGSPTTSSTATVNSTTGQRVTVSSSVQQQRAMNYSCIRRSSDGRYYVNWRYKYRNITTDTTSVQDARYEYDDPNATVDGLMYRQVQFDVSDYKDFQTVTTLTGRSSGRPAWVTSAVWEGCIEERQTVSDDSFTFVPGDGITPSDAFDLDIDSAPDTSDDATKWAPMWPEVAYYRDDATANFTLYTNSSGPYGQANSYCPFQSSLLAEWSEDDFDDYVDSLNAEGSTYHDIGLLWGARLSSPQGIWGDLVGEEPDNGSTVSRHLIFMTDGELAPNDDIQSSYGVEINDHRVTDDGSSDQQDSRHRLRFLAICEAVRDKGIRLWVIAFGTGLTADLETCASDNSAFAASNATQLNEKFQEIAKQVGELRVTQ